MKNNHFLFHDFTSLTDKQHLQQPHPTFIIPDKQLTTVGTRMVKEISLSLTLLSAEIYFMNPPFTAWLCLPYLNTKFQIFINYFYI